MPIGLSGNYSCVSADQPIVRRVRRTHNKDTTIFTSQNATDCGVFAQETININGLYYSNIIIQAIPINNNSIVECGSFATNGLLEILSDSLNFRVFGKYLASWIPH